MLLLCLALASPGRSFAALSLPIGICTYLMMRVLGALSRAHGGLATGVCGTADSGVMTGAVSTCRMLALTFFATDTIAFQAAAGTLCTNSSLYSIACPVPFPISLLVRLVIAKVSWSSLDSRHLQYAISPSSGVPSAPNPRSYQLTSL